MIENWLKSRECCCSLPYMNMVEYIQTMEHPYQWYAMSWCLGSFTKPMLHWSMIICSINKHVLSLIHPFSSSRQHPSYGDCLEVKREYYQNCSVLDCVTQCSQSAAHLIWAVLTGPTDWVCHNGTLMPCVEAVA